MLIFYNINKFVTLCLSVKTVLGNIFCSPKKIHYLGDSPDFSQLGQQCHIDNNEVWIFQYIFILLLNNSERPVDALAEKHQWLTNWLTDNLESRDASASKNVLPVKKKKHFNKSKSS